MKLEALTPLSPYCWAPAATAPGRPAPPVRLFGSEALLAAMDEKVLEQITNVARLPGLVGCAMTMPDAHWGYGFPIGGVAAFDPDAGGIISAGGVGFDISCGIRCLRTNLTLAGIAPCMEALANELFRTIPAGVGEGGDIRLTSTELDEVMQGGARWAVSRGFGTVNDLEFVEERGTMADAKPRHVSDLAKKRQRGEMGTLGSGNHYLEVQVVDRIHDAEAAHAYGLAEGQIVVSIHCGSRGLGHQIGTDYLVSLAKAASRLGVHLPDRELACAPLHSPEGEQYLGAMNAAINIALANRQILAQLTRDAFGHVLPEARLETLFDVSHNTCKPEWHEVDGKRKLLYVHRKGATRAFGPGHPEIPERYRAVGQPVIIGGSMGTGSYVLSGTAQSEHVAFSSASHGAGRAMSRTAALKHWNGRELIDSLRARGILICTKSMRGAAEEAPGAYKDVEMVAEATERAGLAKRVAFLRPKACVKG
ncbi:MAG: RtcB family protein [Burkholderiales bacterium]|jgi:tRNA-splicing ligase RtcB|nr:RtcB family protein [Burkholderiales bacterium]